MTDQPDRVGQNVLFGVRLALVSLLSLLLIAVAIQSLRWNFGYDTAQMLWYGRLIGQLHYVPYRDIFEENLPGAILAYTGIGALIDYSNRGMLRVFDLMYLTAIGLATWRWLRPIGRLVAWAAIALFGVFYLLGGPGFSTQREYVLLLPVVAGLAVSTSAPSMPDLRRAFIVGLLFGIATTIKPHAALGLLPVFVFHYFRIKARQGGAGPSAGKIAGVLAAYALGGVIPIVAIVVYLAAAGGLDAWLAIVLNYWPLYASTTGDIRVVTGTDRLQFTLSALASLGGQTAWLIPAAIGAGLALWRGGLSAARRRRAWLMIGLAVVYALYPALTGQFYPQHWLPMTFFLLAVCALCFIRPPEGRAAWLAAAPLAAVALALALRGEVLAGGVGQIIDSAVYHKPPPSIDGDRGQEIADYLRQNMKPGDTVQSLDPVGYAMHGMLLADATPSTRFMADAPFYTQPDQPYIKGLRSELVDAMNAKPPRFVIDVVARARLRSGHNVPPFDALDDLLRTDYTPIYLGHGFLIYEHVTGVRPGVVAYPSENSGATPEDLAPLKDDLLTFASGKPAANEDAMARRLEALTENHDHIYFENLGEDSPSGAAIEGWLTKSAYRVGMAQLASTRRVEYVLQRGEVCPPVRLSEVYRFSGEVELRSIGIGRIETGSGLYVCVRLQMAALHPITRPYEVSVYITGNDITPVRYAAQPLGGGFPMTSWIPGQPVDDQIALRMPDDLPRGEYHLGLYIYDPDTRLTLAFAPDLSNVVGFKMQLP